MSEKKTYQERVQEAAQLHADKWNSHIQYEEEYEARFTDADCIEDGKVTVAAQADAIRKALMWAYEGKDTCQALESHSNDIELYLLEHGYVEPKNKQ